MSFKTPLNIPHVNLRHLSAAQKNSWKNTAYCLLANWGGVGIQFHVARHSPNVDSLFANALYRYLNKAHTKPVQSLPLNSAMLIETECWWTLRPTGQLTPTTDHHQIDIRGVLLTRYDASSKTLYVQWPWYGFAELVYLPSRLLIVSDDHDTTWLSMQLSTISSLYDWSSLERVLWIIKCLYPCSTYQQSTGKEVSKHMTESCFQGDMNEGGAPVTIDAPSLTYCSNGSYGNVCCSLLEIDICILAGQIKPAWSTIPDQLYFALQQHGLL